MCRSYSEANRLGHEHLLRQLHEAKGLGHLAGAGAVIARRAAYQQDPRRRLRLRPQPLRLLQTVAGFAPLHRQLVRGIGKARAGRLRDRRFAAVAIGLPGKFLEASQRGILGPKRRVEESLHEALVELGATQRGRRLALAYGAHARSLRSAPSSMAGLTAACGALRQLL
jgi:hypothetical protein